RTIADLKNHPNLRNYLIAFFFYIDAVETIIVFASVYATSTLHFSLTELVYLFAVVQVTAMMGAFVFGAIGERIGLLRSLYINISCWILITGAVFFTNDKMSFFVIAAAAGTFMGATQSVSRALMARLMPVEMRAEIFGFYALMDKTSTLVGPLTFGLVSWLTGSEKYAVLSMAALFVLGMVLLLRVKVEREAAA
ncbi:MAG: MFS transporter, partial [Spirochaetia bacterium]|nr:MFS transporter [Spirochaetia bacterium]